MLTENFRSGKIQSTHSQWMKPARKLVVSDLPLHCNFLGPKPFLLLVSIRVKRRAKNENKNEQQDYFCLPTKRWWLWWQVSGIWPNFHFEMDTRNEGTQPGRVFFCPDTKLFTAKDLSTFKGSLQSANKDPLSLHWPLVVPFSKHEESKCLHPHKEEKLIAAHGSHSSSFSFLPGRKK